MFLISHIQLFLQFIGEKTRWYYRLYHVSTLFFISLISLVLFCPYIAISEEYDKNVLYINSYHDGYRWSDSILEGIRSELDASWYKIGLQVEYMDAKKFKNDSVTKELVRLYEEKFKSIQFNVVMVSDDDAFNFALQYRPQLFPDVPIVFCGVNSITLEETQAGNLTGVVENFDLASTIEVALKLHSGKRRMIVVGDDSTTGVAIKKRIDEIIPIFRNRLDVEYWIQLDLEEVKQRVKKLPDDAFLFFIPYYQIIGERFYTSEEVVAAIYSNSNVPIYSSWDFLLGHGLVGGSFLSGFEHGKEAAKKTIQILDGRPASSIPINFETTGEYVFDYKVMKRLALDEKQLPFNSTLINEPDPFYKLSRELFWMIIVSVPLLLATVFLLVLNMAARRSGERKIKNQLTFQETLIDTIPQLVSWKDVHGRYMGANRTYTTFFGLGDITDVIQKNTKEVIVDQQYVKWSMEADRAVVDEEKEFRRIRKEISGITETVSWLEVNKVPLRDQDGTISGILTTAENVTREKNLENQLIQSQKMEAIGTLAGGIAHDFNNILTSIINSTELAIGDIPRDTQTEKDLQRVLKAARRGGDVVKQILSFSRPTKDGFRSTNLASVIAEVVSLLEVSLPSNILVISDIKMAIPDIYADPTQIHQAIMNLCTNGFHALRNQGGTLLIGVREVIFDLQEASYMALPAGDYIQLTVKDDGIGIPPEIKDKIFDPFFSSKEKSEGTGLGLTVVHGIVKGHGGAVRVESEVGVGTVFELYLPKVSWLETSKLDDHEPVIAVLGRILLVEDDIDQLQSAARLLRQYGYDVVELGDSIKAATMISTQAAFFDLVITDYDMPGLNGIEFVEIISKYAEKLPVIMISGREEALKAASTHGVVRVVLRKPYDKKDLYTVINRILREE